MSAPVDVLAVLEFVSSDLAIAQEAFDAGNKMRGLEKAAIRVSEARAAIAELIERERVMRAALEQAVTSMQDSGYSNDHIAVRAARAVLRACGSTPSYPTPSQSVGNAASVEGGA